MRSYNERGRKSNEINGVDNSSFSTERQVNYSKKVIYAKTIIALHKKLNNLSNVLDIASTNLLPSVVTMKMTFCKFRSSELLSMA